MRRTAVLLFVLALAVLCAAKSDKAMKTKKPEKSLKALPEKEKTKEVKGEKEKEKEKGHFAKVYHHVHHSTASKTVKPRMKEPVMRDPLVFGADDIAQEKLDQLKKMENTKKNPVIEEYEMKYQKILAEVINDLKVNMNTPTYVVLKEVEKRMEEKEQAKHVKTSVRMTEYLKKMIAKLYESYEETGKEEEEPYGIKEFVSNVFGKYRMRHEEEQERRRRIQALSRHMDTKHNKKEHRTEFHDQFYTPPFAGFDPVTGESLHVFAPLERPTTARYSGYAVDAPYDSQLRILQAQQTTAQRKPGFFPRSWNTIKGWFQ